MFLHKRNYWASTHNGMPPDLHLQLVRDLQHRMKNRAAIGVDESTCWA
jgi:hypothetical protein